MSDEFPQPSARRPDVDIRVAADAVDVRACYAVVAQLRPHLSEADFVAQVARQQREGYVLARLAEGGHVRAVAGFRIMEMLVSGRHMYVDDLVTDEAARSRGYGARLLEWLAQHARAAGCRELQLDSGVQRTGAHRFYFRQGMYISSFHFRQRLEDGNSDRRAASRNL